MSSFNPDSRFRECLRLQSASHWKFQPTTMPLHRPSRRKSNFGHPTNCITSYSCDQPIVESTQQRPPIYQESNSEANQPATKYKRSRRCRHKPPYQWCKLTENGRDFDDQSLTNRNVRIESIRNNNPNSAQWTDAAARRSVNYEIYLRCLRFDLLELFDYDVDFVGYDYGAAATEQPLLFSMIGSAAVWEASTLVQTPIS